MHEVKDEDTGVVEQTYKSMINADAQDEQNRDFMNISMYNLNSLDLDFIIRLPKNSFLRKTCQ